ncbi:MAG: carboxylating nicotinate-nucleotide diphosphorylase [Myxococcales bacterium]|nr:carboxylating nicotinate-nucleotide diphosphorylase [Polyangiaceae bacterium]MDW8247757.1 carboxylating nicotinate-nucleotide diphosphorylase [Myxococcales bacterium]
MWIAPPVLDEIVDRTLREDLHAGDLSAESTVPAHVLATGTAVARAPLVVCGGDVFQRVFERLEPSVVFESLVDDGTKVGCGTMIWRVQGSARAILMGERSALNLTQRMSGIATLARTYVEALPPGCATRITDTRKTTPGLRVLERYAVRCGGAFNHRDSLGAAVMIKDNHITAAGGILAAVERARRHAPHTSRIEVEVASLEQLEQALAANADIIMLDNFSPEYVAEAVRRARGKAILEASGGVTLATLPAFAAAGVDVISVGALTHSAPAADIALDLALLP